MGIVLGISYMTRINYELHFSWQAQYLVKLENESFLLFRVLNWTFYVNFVIQNKTM